MKESERKLVSNTGLILFGCAILLLTLYSIPDDLEIGKLKTSSFQSEEAEEILKQVAETHSNDPRVIRLLAETLRYQGKIDEVLKLYDRLVHLRPRNPDYWKLYSELLTFKGRDLEAVRANERYLRLKEDFDLQDLKNLINDYQWVESYQDSLRLYTEILSEYPYGWDEVKTATPFFMQNQASEKLERLLFGANRAKGLTPYDLYRILFPAYAQFGNPVRATYFAAKSLRATDQEAENAWKDATYLRRFSASELAGEKETLESLRWIYLNEGKIEQGLEVYHAMDRAGLLLWEDLMGLVDIMTELKKEAEAKNFLLKLAARRQPTKLQWMDIAKRYRWMGEVEKSTLILESLLSDGHPNVQNLR